MQSKRRRVRYAWGAVSTNAHGVVGSAVVDRIVRERGSVGRRIWRRRKRRGPTGTHKADATDAATGTHAEDDDDGDDDVERGVLDVPAEPPRIESKSGGLMSAHLDPAQLDAHLDRMLKHLYVEIDATDAQKQALGPVVKAAVRDLLPLHDRLHSTRDQAVALLTQPTIDRAALESLRASQLAVAEQASKRLAQALADMADVLTPDQRKAIAEHMARRHGPRG